jgi:hypothetical protein
VSILCPTREDESKPLSLFTEQKIVCQYIAQTHWNYPLNPEFEISRLSDFGSPQIS